MAAEADEFLSSLPQPANFSAFRPCPVVPGQDVTQQVTQFTQQLVTGSGLVQRGAAVVATVAGALLFKPPNRYWVERFQRRRYIPVKDEMVIGTVLQRTGESYRVDIHGSSAATLSLVAFDGASKRNRPELEIGTLIYARVEMANKDMEPELSCCTLHGPKRDWMTGQSMFGELGGGYVFSCSHGLARRLLEPICSVLQALGQQLAFEIAVGLNGRVWVNAKTIRETFLVANAILATEHSTAEQAAGVVAALMAHKRRSSIESAAKR